MNAPHVFDRFRYVAFWLVAGLLLAGRGLHFGPQIDSPHQWRQCDTANYAYDFYEDGIDLLHPTVCWMGGHGTVILEFPLPEAVTAVLYRVFGPDHGWARLVTLLFFLMAVVYLYRFVRLLGDTELARWTALVYLALPLGIFYSRAVHVDFAAVGLAHGMLYHLSRGFRDHRGQDFAVGGIWGTLALLTKAPYVFYLALPLLYCVVYFRAYRMLLRQLHWLLLPLVVFVPWQMHVRAVNAAAPDWYFIPDYSKFVDKWGWYFGIWEMRKLDWVWGTIGKRFLYEVLGGFYGLVPFGVGIAALGWRSPVGKAMRWWALGTFAYVFIFFNLNFVHNYYQIPLMVPAAFFVGRVLFELRRRLDGRWSGVGSLVAGLLLVGFAGNSWRLTEGINLNGAEAEHFAEYYQTSPLFEKVGTVVENVTERNDLIIMSYGGLDCRVPNMLYRARRHGWSIEERALSPALLEQLRGEGAAYLAWLFSYPPSPELGKYLGRFPFTEHSFGKESPPLFIYQIDSIAP